MREPAEPEVVLIAALAESNRVIGRDGDLPWHIPDDLKRFKRLTLGHPVLIGRTTFESIVRRLGGPLPGRRNLVLTSRQSPSVPSAPSAYAEVEIVRSIADALESVAAESAVYVIGGASVYEQLLPMADRLELTLVAGEWEGDSHFPPYEHLVGGESGTFRAVAEEEGDGYRFVTLERAASDGSTGDGSIGSEMPQGPRSRS